MDESPILIVPYMWIGDFVRCHTVVRLLKQRFPARPVDVLTTAMVAPLLDYMPGVRKGIVFDIPRREPAFGLNWRLSRILKAENYSKAIITSRKWKAALAPALAGIPERVGFVGEWRYGLLTDIRHGEKNLPRMIDQCAVLALPASEQRPGDWPLPELVVPERKSPLGVHAMRSPTRSGRPWRSVPARSGRASAGPRRNTPHSRSVSPAKGSPSGCWAARAKRNSRGSSPVKEK
jgi:heptosyltransferase-2